MPDRRIARRRPTLIVPNKLRQGMLPIAERRQGLVAQDQQTKQAELQNKGAAFPVVGFDHLVLNYRNQDWYDVLLIRDTLTDPQSGPPVHRRTLG